MKVVIVSDIFGKTKELISLCDSLNLPCDIIDPYSGKLMHFKDEPEAYDYFMNNVHIKAYFELLQNFISAVSEPSILLGFSIGATGWANVQMGVGPRDVIDIMHIIIIFGVSSGLKRHFLMPKRAV